MGHAIGNGCVPCCRQWLYAMLEVGHDFRLGLHATATDLSMKAATLSGLNDFVNDSIFNFPRVPTFAQHRQ